MRVARFDADRLGVVTEEGVIDLTDRLELTTNDPLFELLQRGDGIGNYPNTSPDLRLDDVSLEAPIRRPGKVVAAPLNYKKHIEEALSDPDLDLDDWFTIEDFGYFLKAPSSVIGPSDSIVLPFTDRRVDHEIELGFVIGEETKDASKAEVLENVFGYTIVLDITVRGDQDRSGRKSYDTFTVVGPWIVPADAIDDPQNLDLELRVNGDLRQQANTSDMVYTCGDLGQYASIGTTLEPGDLVTTGTPDGVGPIESGDVIEATIDSIGTMTVDVEARDRSFEDLHIRKST